MLAFRYLNRCLLGVFYLCYSFEGGRWRRILLVAAAVSFFPSEIFIHLYCLCHQSREGLWPGLLRVGHPLPSPTLQWMVKSSPTHGCTIAAILPYCSNILLVLTCPHLSSLNSTQLYHKQKLCVRGSTQAVSLTAFSRFFMTSLKLWCTHSWNGVTHTPEMVLHTLWNDVAPYS